MLIKREKTAKEKRLRARVTGYQMDEHEFRRMVAWQDGCCAICGIEKPLVIDHDHTTGEVRGLLCGECNLGIGKLQDNAGVLRKALAYLEQTQDE